VPELSQSRHRNVEVSWTVLASSLSSLLEGKPCPTLCGKLSHCGITQAAAPATPDRLPVAELYLRPRRLIGSGNSAQASGAV
jgi:hypothetical protein